MPIARLFGRETPNYPATPRPVGAAEGASAGSSAMPKRFVNVHGRVWIALSRRQHRFDVVSAPKLLVLFLLRRRGHPWTTVDGERTRHRSGHAPATGDTAAAHGGGGHTLACGGAVLAAGCS